MRGMPFRFAFDDVRYIGEKMILVGHVESGVVRCGDITTVPTADGKTFQGKVTSINTGKSAKEISADDSLPMVAVVIGSHPAQKDVGVPAVARG